MKPLLLLLLLMLACGAAAAQSSPTRGASSISTAQAKPLRIVPRRAVQPRVANPKAAAKPKVPAKPSARQSVSRRAAAANAKGQPATALPEIAVEAVPLSPSQRDLIYRIITERPLRPNPVITERILPPDAPPPSLPPISPAATIATGELKLGAMLPQSIRLHHFPVGAVAAVPEIEPYRYAFVGDRVLLVDPATGRVVGAINQ